MQLAKTFSGTLPSIGAAAARQYIFGLTNSVTVYPEKIDFINQTIADFLHDDCGVDAAYEVREGSSYKFLWIFGVPFLFCSTSSLQYTSFYGPYYAGALNLGNATANNQQNSVFFSAANSGTYSFRLCFTGNPDSGFVLRFKGQNSTTISSRFLFKFVKATNLLTGKNAVVWGYDDTVSTGLCYPVNGIDLNEDGSMDQDSFSSNASYFYPFLLTKAVHKTSGGGKFPLVPMMFGVWRAEKVYQYPYLFDLPAALATTSEIQTEIEISGRKFIVTHNNVMSAVAGYLNLGLIEVTD